MVGSPVATVPVRPTAPKATRTTLVMGMAGRVDAGVGTAVELGVSAHADMTPTPSLAASSTAARRASVAASPATTAPAAPGVAVPAGGGGSTSSEASINARSEPNSMVTMMYDSGVARGRPRRKTRKEGEVDKWVCFHTIYRLHTQRRGWCAGGKVARWECGATSDKAGRRSVAPRKTVYNKTRVHK